jgi:hypothetical protein
LNSRIAAFVVLVWLSVAGFSTFAAPVIVLPKTASPLQKFAAHEVRRYVYLRSGTILPIVSKQGTNDAIILSTSRSVLVGALTHAP